MGFSLKKLTRKISDPAGVVGAVSKAVGGEHLKTLMTEGWVGNADSLKAFAGSKQGSIFSGRALLQGGAKEQNMETARTFDVFGSPATAGTKQQTTARAAAVVYGAWAAAGAAGASTATKTSAAARLIPSGIGAYQASKLEVPEGLNGEEFNNDVMGRLGMAPMLPSDFAPARQSSSVMATNMASFALVFGLFLAFILFVKRV